MKKEYIVFIPARGGSKGIVGKNVKLLNGVPLINYTLKLANKIVGLDEVLGVYVSSDMEEILRLKSNYPNFYFLRRPKHLALDTTTTIDVVISFLADFDFDGSLSIIILQPTSPLRSYKDVVNAIELFDSSNKKTLISTFESEGLMDRLYKYDNLIVSPVNATHNSGIARQKKGKYYVRNGAIYITTISYFNRYKRFTSGTPVLSIMPKSRSIDIDDIDDFNMAELIIKNSNI